MASLISDDLNHFGSCKIYPLAFQTMVTKKCGIMQTLFGHKVLGSIMYFIQQQPQPATPNTKIHKTPLLRWPTRVVFNISGGGPKTNGLFVSVFSDEAPWNRSWDDMFFNQVKLNMNFRNKNCHAWTFHTGGARFCLRVGPVSHCIKYVLSAQP